MNKEKNIDWNKIQDVLQQQINTLHEELGWFNKEELENTSRRIKDFYKEWVGNYDFKFTTFENPGDDELVILKDINYYSMCSHHMLPFFGKAHIGYLPKKNGKICGVSKLARAVRKFASMPQLQERLTSQIADFIVKEIDPAFVIVVVEGQHLCMLMRGIKQHDSKMVTSAIRWDKSIPHIRDNFQQIKEEALKLIKQ